MNWKFFASMAAGMLQSAGVAKQMEDENETGTDDVVGDGMVYGAKLINWLIAGGPKSGKKPPVIPDGLQ